MSYPSEFAPYLALGFGVCVWRYVINQERVCVYGVCVCVCVCVWYPFNPPTQERVCVYCVCGGD
jgi:hypothetical protein